MAETTMVVKEVKALKSGTNQRGEWTIYGLLDGNDELFGTTFDKGLFDTAKQFEGGKALVEFEEDEKGRKIKAVKPPPAETNGTPALGTGEYVRGQTAPTDAERMARGAAWKVVGNDAFIKAVMAIHSAEEPGTQLTHMKLHDLLARHTRLIANNIIGGDENIPF